MAIRARPHRVSRTVFSPECRRENSRTSRGNSTARSPRPRIFRAQASPRKPEEKPRDQERSLCTRRATAGASLTRDSHAAPRRSSRSVHRVKGWRDRRHLRRALWQQAAHGAARPSEHVGNRCHRHNSPPLLPTLPPFFGAPRDQLSRSTCSKVSIFLVLAYLRSFSVTRSTTKLTIDTRSIVVGVTSSRNRRLDCD